MIEKLRNPRYAATMTLTANIVRDMQRAAWGDGRKLEIYGDRQNGVVDGITERGVYVQWDRHILGASFLEWARIELSSAGKNLCIKDWHDIPRELKIQDVFDGIRGWDPRQTVPVLRVPMPQSTRYHLITDDVPQTIEMDILDFRMHHDGSVTCEGITVQPAQRDNRQWA